LINIVTGIYVSILLFYLLRTISISLKTRCFNIPKNAILTGTILSWYFGIVYFNNDLIFTLLNVISHGIPYIALVYLNEIEKKSSTELGFLVLFKNYKGLFFFILILLIIAFSEEFIWEILIWNEQFSITTFDFSNWHFILIPLLTVPQFTHYLLDGFIWKNKHTGL
jgi:hypothetical protein